ncbi:ferritin-like domain-containing protein [Dictyobacter aurantiacus]|uniref:Ferritin-like domain-containing protein n=1 Tax=Dictyobacter aurantiacus TaxID=1936993 RepID=A0A401Z935_9CHLR|nr:ferritin-like domain-containing protein [Dictyobacter aurantiacus]GCE03362.1 hypothetical protein KDAU_06910 [Dictyobacter aurantiacus]
MKPGLNMPTRNHSRRSALKGAFVGVTGLAVAGGAVGAGVLFTEQPSQGAHAAAPNQATPVANNQAITAILNIAATAETLAVTFYSLVLSHADKLGLKEATRINLKATLVEEQLHLLFLNKQGAKSAAKNFSFPFGRDTFKNLELFLKTQQQLESAFVAAYLAAVKELAMLGRPDLAQVAAQLAAIESEHRVVGRLIGAMLPIDNEAFPPLLLKNVAAAPAFLKGAGYLSPRKDNTFEFHAVSTTGAGVTMTMPTVVPSTTTTTPPITNATPAAHLKF